MSNTIIEKIDAREDKDKTWRLSDSQSGHYLNVIFDRNLEEGMKVKRNFSFNRFESEQINELTKLLVIIPFPLIPMLLVWPLCLLLTAMLSQ